MPQPQYTAPIQTQPILFQQQLNHASTEKKLNEIKPGFPVSITTVTQITSFFMAAIIIYCGYIKCNDGSFTCDENRFPDISHVMGKEPLNKLYAIMLTWYACVKQAYVRAYHQKLSGVISSGTNQMLFIYGAVSCIFGPMIGYFDVYYNMTIHCTVVALFVVGEVLYIFTMTSVLNRTRARWSESAQSGIDQLVLCRLITVVLGAITLGSKAISKNIDPYGSYIEWILFCLSFYIFALISTIMPYDDVVVPAEEETE